MRHDANKQNLQNSSSSCCLTSKYIIEFCLKMKIIYNRKRNGLTLKLAKR